MPSITAQLLSLVDAGQSAAYCRLIETRGSTPQKAGATMLVLPDGSQAGTLGGGCVEAEVKRRALAILRDGQIEVCKFNLDSDYGWDDGLICGGRMMVLVVPLHPHSDLTYFRRLNEHHEAGRPATEAIVFDAQASGLQAGAAYLLVELPSGDTRVIATLGSTAIGAPLPRVMQEHLKPLSQRPRPYAAGGIGYIPLLERCRLVIVGGGHVGQAVAELAAAVDFNVWVVDDRAEYISPERFPQAQRRIAGTLDQVLPTLEITPDTYCLIVTRGHNHDQQALLHLAERNARYVGMIGSSRKIRLIMDNLAAEGISSDALSAVYAPVGIDIGSQSVAEIAVSIVAELIAHRNRSGEIPGKEHTNATSI